MLIRIYRAILGGAIKGELREILSGIDDLVLQVLFKGLKSASKGLGKPMKETRACKDAEKYLITLDKWLKPSPT